MPENQQLVFRFATPCLHTWGVNAENYILQQFFDGAGVALVLLTVCVERSSLLRVQCRQGNNIIQYTLMGYAFGKLTGYGQLPLFESTYTLQYVPEGDHLVLFTPGTYHYIYVTPGPFLNAVSAEHPNIAGLITSLEQSHVQGKLACRLSVNGRVKELITKFLNLPGNSAEVGLTITAIIVKLMREFYRQLGGSFNNNTEDRIAAINAYLADHIHEPVPVLIKKITELFYIQSSTLRNHWNGSAGDKHDRTPRTSFKKLRLQYSLYLLIIEGFSVNEVATRLSFRNPFSFSSQFHKYFGVPPTQADGIVEC